MMRGFDSIESMNADSVLVKRRRGGSKRFVVCAVFVGCAFFLVGILIGYFSRTQHQHSAPIAVELAPLRLRPIDFMLTSINEDAIRDSLRQYTSESSVAGMPEAAEFAQKILTRWKASDLDQVYISSHNVPMSLPNQSHPSKVELVEATFGDPVFTAQLQEPPLRPGETGTTDHPDFIAPSPSGDVTADVVYANYGRLEDFEFLKKNLSLDITGKIIILRLGRIYAGNKVHNAEQFGAGAVILYPDPAEFNPSYQTQSQAQPQTDTDSKVNPTNPSKPVNPSVDVSNVDNHGYPESWWMPPTGIRKEALYRIPGTGKTLSIPSISINFEDAAYILRNMSGPVSPASWHGGLSVDYKVGPGFLLRDNGTDLQVHVTVTNFIESRPLHNVIGVIAGSVEPDRYVLIGHHHDTLSKGTVGAHSGSATLDQLVSVFGQLLKQGHRPLRTIIFCSWDGGEQGSLGSALWLQENFRLINERAVAYLNVGVLVEGNFTLHAVASPLLQSSLYDAAKQVHSPDDSFESLYDLWAARPSSKLESSEKSSEPKILFAPGGIGDQSSFYYKAGVSIAELRATFDQEEFPTETYPLYHTAYDTLYAYERFCDPGYKFTTALTQMWGMLILNLANTSVLPMKVSGYAEALNRLTQSDVMSHRDNWGKHGIHTDDLVSAVKRFADATSSFEDRLAAEKKIESSPIKQRMYNDRMREVERAFVAPTGLGDRPSQRHVLFGPNIPNKASGVAFPGIQDVLHKIEHMETAPWSDLERQIKTITDAILTAAKSMEQNPQL